MRMKSSSIKELVKRYEERTTDGVKVERDAKGRVKKGMVLNPGGLRKDSVHTRAKRAWNEVTEAEIRDIVGKLIKDAREGDHRARELAMQYLVPVRMLKDAPLSQKLGIPMKTPVEREAAIPRVLEKVMEGRIGMMEAKELVVLVKEAVQIDQWRELASLQERLAALEASREVGGSASTSGPDYLKKMNGERPHWGVAPRLGDEGGKVAIRKAGGDGLKVK